MPNSKGIRESRGGRAEKVAQALETLLRGANSEEGLMPPLRRIALQQGCSIETARAALALLKTRGLLTRVRGNGRFRIQRAGSIAIPAAPLRNLRIAAMLRSDLYRGQLARGAAMDLKQLAGQYRCDPRTMKKAITALERDGLVRHTPQGYLSAIGTKRGLGRIIVLGNYGNWSSSSGWNERFYRGVEAACRELGWERTEFAEPVALEDLRLDGPSPVAGILCQVRIKGAWTAFYRSVVSACSARGIPAVLLNESDTGAHHAWERPYPKGFILTPDNRAAGQEIGRQLLSRGHEKACFFSAYPFAPEHLPLFAGSFGRGSDGWTNLSKWSHHRFLGLAQAFSEAIGAEACAGIVVVPSPSPTPQIQFGAIRKTFGQLKKHLAGADTLPEDILNQGLAPGWALVDALGLAISAQEAFGRALSDPSLRAWVCANDLLAIMARRFLQARPEPHARRIEVVGFDNSAWAIRAGLPSYDFLPENLGGMAVRAIAAPQALRCGRDRHLRVPGWLAWRETL